MFIKFVLKVSKMEQTKYCADVIALYEDDKIVLVERLKDPKGYALPGGKRERPDGQNLEPIEVCALREFEEETGLKLIIDGYLGKYDSPGRDPRGDYISDTVYGRAKGTL